MKQFGTLFLVLFFALLVCLAFAFEGTGGEGDSVHHFLYAKYAFLHPELFFKHWAKPVWVILMAPVAQFGFTAIKVAGAACLVGSLYFGLLIARKIGMKPEILSVVTAISMPFVYFLSLSGLTEPLFALWMMVGIWLYFEERDLAATAWISFLPLVRSEGLIIFCVVVIYLALRRKWLAFLLLPLGHLVIGILGYPVHKNISWVIKEIPYTHMDAGYGSGKWTHYLTHLPAEIGVFNATLLAAGLLFGLYRMIGYWFSQKAFKMQEMWLIYGMFVAYFVAHTIFWAMGIFNSAGLLRVFLAVVPLMCIIIGRLLELVWNQSQQTVFRSALLVVFAGSSIYCLPKLRDFRYAMSLVISQEAFRDYAKLHPEMKNKIIFTEFVDGAYFLGLDFFNKRIYRNTPRVTGGMTIPENALVIWHNRWSIMEARMPLQALLDHKDLVLTDSIQEWGKPAFYIFEKRNKTGNLDPNLAVQKTYENDTNCTEIQPDSSRVRILHGDCQYSEGLNLWVGEIPENAQALTVSCKVKTVDAQAQPSLRLVLSYEKSSAEIVDYGGQDIPLDVNQADWQKIQLKTPLKTGFSTDVTLKCYLWNPGQAALLDSLVMRWE
jgi:hypothetical protein